MTTFRGQERWRMRQFLARHAVRRSVDKRGLIISIAAAAIVAIVIPVYAMNGSNRTEFESIGASFDEGNLTAEWGSNGLDRLQVFQRNVYQCDNEGEGIAMPSVQKQGVDRVSLTASIPSSDFDHCVGTPPDVVAFDIQIDATHVRKTISSETTQILKGEGTNRSVSSQLLTGSGPVTGTLQGVDVGSGNGFYETFSRTVGGPTTTTPPP